jgi:hypothetical protein
MGIIKKILMVLGVIGLGVCALLVLGVGIMLIRGDHENLRYKMTVTVTTPEGEKSGYAVRSVFCTWLSAEEKEDKSVCEVVLGEAVVIDLGKRGVLFSRIGDADEAHFIFRTFSGKPKGTVPVDYPIAEMVTFTNLKDPKTIKTVDYKNLAKSFGGGVTLKSIKVALTDEPLTKDIAKLLPWLKSKNSYVTSDPACKQDIHHCILDGSFTRGWEK